MEVAPDGNWIHIHYQSKLQAKKVLSKNGKVFGGSIMVGVAPCIDKVGMSQLTVMNLKCYSMYLSAWIDNLHFFSTKKTV